VDGASPDTSSYGDKVAFSATGRGLCGGLCTIKLDGSELRQLTDFGDAGPDWSPGGTELVFTRRSPDEWDIYRIHANGVGLVQLTNTPGRTEFAPVWSPDGTKIAFLGCPAPFGSVPDCGIYMINRDGSGETQVPNLRASSATAEGALDWQPLPPFPQGQAPVALTVSIVARGGTGTVRSAPEGIECPLACSTEFDRGSTIRLEAQPTTRDASFLGWSGACSGRSAPCSVVMDGEKGVAASFGPSRLRLTVSVRGPGRVLSSPAGIACPRRCAASFARDLRVTVRALPARGAKLVGWSGACRGSKGCRVSMSADRAVRARFRR
jgi:hypothetical protein